MYIRCMQVLDAKQLIAQNILDLSAIPASDALVNLDSASGLLSLPDLPNASFRLPLSKELDKLLKEAQRSVRETDVNSFTLAFGLVKLEIDRRELAAPLVLIPLIWQKVPMKDLVNLEPIFEAAEINPYLKHVFRELPNFPGLHDESLPQFPEIFRAFLKEQELGAIVEPQVVIGNLHHARFHFLRELEGILKQDLSPLLSRFLGNESLPARNLPNSEVQLTPLDSDQSRVLEQFHQTDCVIQGPPGTGKSQVLTNIIGRCIDLELATLVLSEKPVALDVLQKKLAVHGLDKHVAVVHANYRSRDFLQQLRAAWEHCENLKLPVLPVLPLSTMRLQSLQLLLERLNQPDLIGGVSRSEFKLLSESVPWQEASLSMSVPDLATWKQWRPRLLELAPVFKAIAGYRSAFFTLEQPDAKLRELQERFQEWKPWMNQGTWEEFTHFEQQFHQCQLVENEHFHRFTQLSDKPREQRKFEKTIRSYRIRRIELEKASFELNVWQTVPTQTQIDSWQAARGYWNKKRARKQLSGMLIDPTVSVELAIQRWEEWHAIRQELYDLECTLLEFGLQPGYAQIEASYQYYEALKKHANGNWNEVQSWPREKRLFLINQQPAFHHLRASLKQLCYWHDSDPIELCLQANVQGLEQLLPCWKQLQQVPEWFFDLLPQAETFAEMEAMILKGNYHRTLALFPELLQSSGEKLKDRIEHIRADEDAEIAHFGKYLQASIRYRFRVYTELLRTVPAKLSVEQRQLRSQLKRGKALLVKEFAKSRSHLSIRELLESDAAPWIRVLMPCWFTTPVQLADHVPLRSNLFDVLIVDEASQMPLPAVFGAMQRANRVVIAGDEQQMAPAQFFGRAISSFDVLHQGMFYFEKYPLRHHYRSKQPDLIAFSNRHFYNEQLVVYPSVQQEQAVFDHFVPNGVYQERVNLPEARALADWLQQFDFKRTLGIVAFSKEQLQTVLKSCDPATQEKIQLGEEQGTVFVKTLENVQGDEAQVLVVSMGYGKDPDGKFALRFGPLNQVNGFKRLNVLLTRAQEELHFFSSVRASDFPLSANEGVGLLKQWLWELEVRFREASWDFPHKVRFSVDNQDLFVYDVETAIHQARDLVVFQRLMQDRGWKLHYV